MTPVRRLAFTTRSPQTASETGRAWDYPVLRLGLSGRRAPHDAAAGFGQHARARPVVHEHQRGSRTEQRSGAWPTHLGSNQIAAFRMQREAATGWMTPLGEMEAEGFSDRPEGERSWRRRVVGLAEDGMPRCLVGVAHGSQVRCKFDEAAFEGLRPQAGGRATAHSHHTPIAFLERIEQAPAIAVAGQCGHW